MGDPLDGILQRMLADMANEGKADLTFARIPYEITIR